MIVIDQGFTSMVLSMQTGVNEDGKPEYKDKSYSRIMPTVTEDVLYEVGEALASLSAWGLHHIQRVDREDLSKIA